jgi:hypothetical protein
MDYKYKVVYKSGKEFVVTTDLDQDSFVQQERKDSKGVEKIFRASGLNLESWIIIYPDPNKYGYY